MDNAILELVKDVLVAALTGLLVALVVYVVLCLVNVVYRIADGTRRSVAGIVGALVALLTLLGRL